MSDMAAAEIRERARLAGLVPAAARVVLALVGPLLVVAAVAACVRLIMTSPDGAIDFRTGIWQPAFDIAHGHAPYPDGNTWRSQDGMPSIYPPFIAVLAVPLGLLSFALASMLWAGLMIAALVLTLWVLGVRDLRLFGGVFLLPPVFDALGLGQVEMLLMLAAALVWRHRDRWPLAAIALGTALAVKPLMLPVLVWLLITRRVRAALASVVVALALALGSWAVIGFSGLRSYPALLQAWERAYGGCGVSIRALASKLGASELVATSLKLAVAAALLVCAWRLSHRLEGERRAFAAAMAAVVVAAPVVWSHYLVYLIVPLALTLPRFDRRWLLLALPWVFGRETSLDMYLAHKGGRIVPTASFVGTDTYLVMLEYLFLTAAVVLVTMRANAARGSRAAGTRNRWARARAPVPAAAVARRSP
jgi:alpha-1,2-mannosyltransferase